MHLAVDPGLYSLEDLLMVKRGSLLDILEEVCTCTRLVSVRDFAVVTQTRDCRGAQSEIRTKIMLVSVFFTASF